MPWRAAYWERRPLTEPASTGPGFAGGDPSPPDTRYGNLGNALSHDGSSNADITDSTYWLGNLGSHLTPGNELNMHLQFIHTGEHARASGVMRDNMSAYTTADPATEWQAARRLIPRTEPRNLADVGRHDAAPADTHVDDFPRSGRTLWLGLANQASD